MSYTNFANQVILALYRETEGDMSARVELRSLLRKYGIQLEKEFWLNNLQNEWAGNGQAQFIDAGTNQQRVAIQINGVRVAESLPQDILVPPIVPDPSLSSISSTEPALTFHPASLDSTSWTGLSTKMTAAQLSEIRQQVADLCRTISQSDADHVLKLNAIKRVEAVQSLLEAPDVPWQEVVELLNSPSVSAFLVAVNLIQFLMALAS